MSLLKSATLLFALLVSLIINSQTDEEVIKTIYKQSLTNGKSYDWLNHLSNQIGGRLSGSLNAEKAVAYTKEELIKLVMVLAGLRPDSQRYFDHHHASNDTFDAVNKRELELGAATMTALVYLFDKYGVNPISNQKTMKN